MALVHRIRWNELIVTLMDTLQRVNRTEGRQEALAVRPSSSSCPLHNALNMWKHKAINEAESSQNGTPNAQLKDVLRVANCRLVSEFATRSVTVGLCSNLNSTKNTAAGSGVTASRATIPS